MSTSAPVILLPVKPPSQGKSRLASLPPDLRRDLALAFALDTLTAVISVATVSRVLVLTSDTDLTDVVRRLGVESVPDPSPGDLNAALRRTADELDADQPVMALCADLPALRGNDLAAFIDATAGSHARFVRDTAGGGTTTYAAAARLFSPRFGHGSAAAHLASGAVASGEHLVRLRADVDTAEDLAYAVSLGVGPHTSAVLAR